MTRTVLSLCATVLFIFTTACASRQNTATNDSVVVAPNLSSTSATNTYAAGEPDVVPMLIEALAPEAPAITVTPAEVRQAWQEKGNGDPHQGPGAQWLLEQGIQFYIVGRGIKSIDPVTRQAVMCPYYDFCYVATIASDGREEAGNPQDVGKYVTKNGDVRTSRLAKLDYWLSGGGPRGKTGPCVNLSTTLVDDVGCPN